MTNMELIIALATKFWQWSILIAVVIITFLINLLDKKKKSNLTFHADKMPELKPVAIKTKGKGFWKGIVMWLLGTRNWEITKDWKYRVNGNEYVIPKGFVLWCKHTKIFKNFFLTSWRIINGWFSPRLCLQIRLSKKNW